MIRNITIKNIKGIGDGTPNGQYQFDIYPNKPTIFVAPNGFGKSSFATAFNSLKPSKVDLHKNHYFEGDNNHNPEISIDLEINGVQTTYSATPNINTIKNVFDIFVINNKAIPKARTMRIAGANITTATLEISPVVLIKSVPNNTRFSYSLTEQKRQFGTNSKVLSNISGLLKNPKFVREVPSLYTQLAKFTQVRVSAALTAFNIEFNTQTGTKAQLLTWIDHNKLMELNAIAPLQSLFLFLKEIDTGVEKDAEHYLNAIQIALEYCTDSTLFKNAVKRVEYDIDKAEYKTLFQGFNTSWRDFKPIEKNGKLIVNFPNTQHISNGQRDVMIFISMLKKAEKMLKKDQCILIIDEVFDYLDDANLIAVQYYVTKLIKVLKDEGKKLYPIILTHLDPQYFRNFTFSKQKIFYLDKRSPVITTALKNLLENRSDPLIDNNISKFHLHFDPSSINIRPDFETLNLNKPTWGDSNLFDSFLEAEYIKYSQNEDSYDPFAICCYLRKKIERLIYEKLTDQGFKLEFLSKHRTTVKLEYAEEKGVLVPDSFYLLGVVYNDGMHYKNNDDAISGKLENHTIKHIIMNLERE